ncbi:hypothetical protein [Escherichia coli]|uniref:hypothetical protein n=1 Tax=Escherichia coli TaxID=562 RepID=UPI002019D6DB|nr:hypothetical protein [Escherichia coli]
MWAVALSCIVTWFLIRIYGRYASVTGERALTAFRRHIHPGVAVGPEHHVNHNDHRDSPGES